MGRHEARCAHTRVFGTVDALVITYDRPWRQLWRKRRIVRCWNCGLRIPEPLWLRQPQPRASGHLMAIPGSRQ